MQIVRSRPPLPSELTPANMPKPSQVTGPTTIIKHSTVTSAAAVRGLEPPCQPSKHRIEGDGEYGAPQRRSSGTEQ